MREWAHYANRRIGPLTLPTPLSTGERVQRQRLRRRITGAIAIITVVLVGFSSLARSQDAPPTQPATQPLPSFTEAEFLRQLASFRAGGSVKFNPGIYAINNTVVLTLPGTYDMTGVELRGRKGTLIWIRG